MLRLGAGLHHVRPVHDPPGADAEEAEAAVRHLHVQGSAQEARQGERDGGALFGAADPVTSQTADKFQPNCTVCSSLWFAVHASASERRDGGTGEEGDQRAHRRAPQGCECGRESQ